MNYLDKKISKYNGVTDTIGTVITIRDFICSRKYKDTIMQLRSFETKEERSKIKRTLPLATISGEFSPARKTENLKQHSGLICIDIDASDNPHITDWEDLKMQLSVLPQIFYVSLSVSGKGLFVIIPLKYPEYHVQQFKKLELDFAAMSIKIDSACKDITRMRCISFDENPYINEHAKPYDGYYREPQPIVRQMSIDEGSTLENVRKCVEKIAANRIDLTADYDSWFRICGALASLGESGRGFFHVCSSQNPSYKYQECERKFDNLLRTNKRLGIGTFFDECLQYGITWKKK